MTFRGVTFGISFLAGIALAGGAWAGQLGVNAPSANSPGAHPIVIELFTSQGCSDCPAADRLLSELAQRKDIVALTFPVTYWDMLGWKDTFATESNTQRQKSYSRTLNRSGIYTPQIVLDGQLDMIGNQRERVLEALAAREASNNTVNANGIYVPIAISVTQNRIEVAIPQSRGKEKPFAAIWVMRTLSQGVANVGQGENRNRLLTYTNVVRHLQRAGEWTGEAMKLDFPLNVADAPHDGVAVILQSHDFGPVLGAALLTISPSNRRAAPR